MKVVILRRIEQMKVSTVPFKGTKEQEAKLLEVIAKYKGQKGALMPIMQEAQEIYGYLPYQVQKIISDETGIRLRASMLFPCALEQLATLRAQEQFSRRSRKFSKSKTAAVHLTASSHWKFAVASEHVDSHLL